MGQPRRGERDQKRKKGGRKKEKKQKKKIKKRKQKGVFLLCFFSFFFLSFFLLLFFLFVGGLKCDVFGPRFRYDFLTFLMLKNTISRPVSGGTLVFFSCFYFFSIFSRFFFLFFLFLIYLFFLVLPVILFFLLFFSLFFSLFFPTNKEKGRLPNQKWEPTKKGGETPQIIGEGGPANNKGGETAQPERERGDHPAQKTKRDRPTKKAGERGERDPPTNKRKLDHQKTREWRRPNQKGEIETLEQKGRSRPPNLKGRGVDGPTPLPTREGRHPKQPGGRDPPTGAGQRTKIGGQATNKGR